MELSRIHGFLFKGVLPHDGQLRTYNITKNQWILDGDTISYGSADSLSELLNYDFGEERKFDYSTVSSADAIKHVVRFISGIWQIHAFGEGNTRTTAVFLIKYLKSFGFEVNNESLKSTLGSSVMLLYVRSMRISPKAFTGHSSHWSDL